MVKFHFVKSKAHVLTYSPDWPFPLVWVWKWQGRVITVELLGVLYVGCVLWRVTFTVLSVLLTSDWTLGPSLPPCGSAWYLTSTLTTIMQNWSLYSWGSRKKLKQAFKYHLSTSVIKGYAGDQRKIICLKPSLHKKQ